MAPESFPLLVLEWAASCDQSPRDLVAGIGTRVRDDPPHQGLPESEQGLLPCVHCLQDSVSFVQEVVPTAGVAYQPHPLLQ